MTYRRKIITIALLALGLLLLSGIIAIKLMLTEERLAGFARDEVQSSLGRELKLENLSLQLRPLPTVRLKNAALANPSWAKEAFFLHADHVTARLDLTSLMRGKLEIASLTIEGLTANLEVSSDNRKNWQMRGNTFNQKSGDTPLVPLHLASIQLKDVRIRYAKHGEPLQDWRVNELSADAEPEWRNIALDANLIRNGVALRAKARLSDLSRIGHEGAVSEGSMEFFLGTARLTVSGLIPISGTLDKHKMRADFSANTSKDISAFFGLADINLAPIKANVNLQHNSTGIQASDLFFQIGRLNLNGDAQIHLAGAKPHYRARLASEHLDWAQTIRDFGRPPLPPKPPGQLFRDTPLGWRAVSMLQKIEGKTELRIQRVKLRSGIELKDLKADFEASEKLLRIEKFSFAMLDGQANGSLAMDGHKRTAKLNLEMNKVSLGKWLAARGHRIALTDGPMHLKASLSGKGISMRDLAGSLTGPVTISVGPAKLHSKQIRQAETWLIGLAPVFSATEAEQVHLACMSAYFPFKNGRAAAEPVVGIRSEASQVLASGYIDLKRQTMDLRGRVRARSGVSLGISNIAGGDLKIAGRIDKPETGLDPESTPAALARIGAAIVTSGVSLLATALWDAANPSSDPCQIIFSAHEKRRTLKPKNDSVSQTTAETN